MINRDNYKLRLAYLDYVENVRRRDPHTVYRQKSSLRYLLEWADDRPLEKAPKIRPTFPAYLDQFDLSNVTKHGITSTAAQFFSWARYADPRRFIEISPLWIETLYIKSTRDERDHEFFTLEEITRMCAIAPESLIDQRNAGAVAFLFLSGMRAGAFTTMPILAFDPVTRQVRQWPKFGVKTKLGKKATTFLLNIPDLFDVVRQWDSIVRAALPDTGPWFARMTTDGHDFDKNNVIDTSRNGRIGAALRSMCHRAGIEYRSPHAIRHGHAIYALKQCKDIYDLKAVSQNLMHASISTTDGIYGILPDHDIQSRIERLQ